MRPPPPYPPGPSSSSEPGPGQGASQSRNVSGPAGNRPPFAGSATHAAYSGPRVRSQAFRQSDTPERAWPSGGLAGALCATRSRSFLDRLSFHFYSLTTCPKNRGNFIVHGLLGLYTFAKKNTHSGKTRAFARFSASANISSFALSMTVSKSLRVRTLPAKGGGIFLKVPG